MSFIAKIRGDRVSLAPVAFEDAEKWVTWLNDLEVAVPLGDEAYVPITFATARRDIEHMCSNGQHVFTVVHNETGLAIGRCMLFNVDLVNRSSMLGIFIGEKTYWGNGLGKEAIILTLDYAFNLLNLNSVMLGAFSFNTRAIRCYMSVGFKEIGRRRQSRLIAGRSYDGVLMDMLAGEYRERYESRVNV